MVAMSRLGNGAVVLHDLLREHASADNDSSHPLLFEADRAADQERLAQLLRGGAVAFVHDTLIEQIKELVSLRAPARTFNADDLEREVLRYLGGRPPGECGAWVFFPWSRRLVHLLPKEEFREVRSDRNRYKITSEEQRRLAGCRIGVVGLSVGNMVAVTLALEGVGGHFRIADFDQLSLSNLNRLRGSVHDLQVSKTTLAAREMFEIDPWLEILPFSRGLEPDNIDDFLNGAGRLDLLIEECDDLYMKIAVRERARSLGIPVLMDTSDRGLLDIERFDREPHRPLLHGLIGDLDARRLRGLSTKEKVPIVLAILGADRISLRMAASLPEVNESISSWPQLASSVALGGALSADVARRILLGSFTGSGRFYVDVEQIVRDGAGEYADPVQAQPMPEIASEAAQARTLPSAPADVRFDSVETVGWLVSHAVLSPSAHNSQPWKFVWRKSALELIHDPTHDLPSLDFEGTATALTFGCVAETLEIAARAGGLALDLAPFPDPGNNRLMARATFRPSKLERDPLVTQITRRVTNRRRGPRALLAEGDLTTLGKAARARGAHVLFLTEPGSLTEVGRLIGACDRLSYMNSAIHRDVFAGFRWSSAEVLAHRDGLDIASLELSPTERAGTQLLSAWPVMAELKAFGGGKVLEDTAVQAIDSASAVALLVFPGMTCDSYFQAGRALQRFWLTATELGIFVQPMTGLPYLFARLEQGNGVGFDEDERVELRALRKRYRALFTVPPGHAEAFLMRLGKAEAPSALSLRRPLGEVLSFA